MKLFRCLLICISSFTYSLGFAGDEYTFRVALIQLDSSNVGNYETILKYAQFASDSGAELVVFPEASAFGWLNPVVFTKAQPIPGPISDRFSDIAKKAGIWVAVGLAERGPKAASGVYHAYDSAVLLDPDGEIVLHHRKNNVLKDAFDPEECPPSFGTKGCSYTAGTKVSLANTPFGRTTLLVCADAYTSDKSTLDKVKLLSPDVVIVPWGVAAEAPDECGKKGYNATDFAAQAAGYLETAYVIGANGRGKRPYGRFLPSVYCGNSGYARPDGEIGGLATPTEPVAFFNIPRGQQ